MEPKDLAVFLANALADKKAEDIAVLEVESLVSYTSYFIVATGRSDRQVAALADHARQSVKQAFGRLPLGVEGSTGGQWALVDFGDVIVHVFRDEARLFYDIDGLWEDAPRLDFEQRASARTATAARA